MRPEPDQIYGVLWGELFWRDSINQQSSLLRLGADALVDGTDATGEELFHPATAAYVRERSTDNSVEDALEIDFPIQDLVNGLGAVASDPEQGAWLDADGMVVAFAPAVTTPGPASVLVRRERLETWLRDSTWALVWILLSEKQIVGGDHRHWHGRLVTSGAFWLREAPDGTFTIEGGHAAIRGVGGLSSSAVSARVASAGSRIENIEPPKRGHRTWPVIPPRT
jgi:hypothetical protein